MIRFPVLNLPDELTYLMRAQLNSVEVQQKVVLETINKNYALVQMLESLFQEYDSQKRLPQVIKKISWNQFRDKFTSIYIYHQVHKKFPDKTSLELVRDIQVLEDKLSDYSVGSNSRAFL
jgi:sulfur relay (sulfurtransferase) DsrC/TusE family protein